MSSRLYSKFEIIQKCYNTLISYPNATRHIFSSRMPFLPTHFHSSDSRYALSANSNFSLGHLMSEMLKIALRQFQEFLVLGLLEAEPCWLS